VYVEEFLDASLQHTFVPVSKGHDFMGIILVAGILLSNVIGDFLQLIKKLPEQYLEDPLRCLLLIRVVEKEVQDADFWCLEEPVENNRPNSSDKSL